MNNVTNLNANSVTAQEALDAAKESNPAHVYIVCFDEDGVIDIYASGNLKHLSEAAVALTNMASDNLRDRMRR